ncbi:ribonuclease III [Arthrobacter sp. N199823]|uniref:ribonuclease III n=1 Tax=Arthrobacter sp. N199823 TaxID=2058895 RepID=UPI000CE51114|nr:ribonuclease III [Arthrobacter sp. N199823]
MSAEIPSSELTDGHKLLLKRLGVSIDAGTLRLALTHRSYAYENGGIPTNERLEFLGDSILGFSVTDALYRDNPLLPEGDLAKRRSAVVSTRALASIGRELGIGEFIYLGQGERLTKGRNKSSILADTMEALIGATYLTHGIEVARQLVMRLVGPLLADSAVLGAGTDWKTNIQEIAAARRLGTIVYDITGVGPDHNRSFTASLIIGGKHYSTGTGPSKKEAERTAAAAAWVDLEKKFGSGSSTSASSATATATSDAVASAASGSPAASSASAGSLSGTAAAGVSTAE